MILSKVIEELHITSFILLLDILFGIHYLSDSCKPQRYLEECIQPFDCEDYCCIFGKNPTSSFHFVNGFLSKSFIHLIRFSYDEKKIKKLLLMINRLWGVGADIKIVTRLLFERGSFLRARLHQALAALLFQRCQLMLITLLLVASTDSYIRELLASLILRCL